MTFLVGHTLFIIIHYLSIFYLFIYQLSVVEHECFIQLNVCYHVTTLFVDVISRRRAVLMLEELVAQLHCTHVLVKVAIEYVYTYMRLY